MTNADTPVAVGVDSWTERLNAEETRALQFRLMRHLCEWAEARSPFYRDHWRTARFSTSQLKSLDDVRRIPVVTKHDLLDDQNEAPPYGRRLAVPEDEIFKVFLTSGTTGIGQEVHGVTRSEWLAAGSAKEFLFRQAGLKGGESLALTLPLSMQTGGPDLYHGAERYGLRTLALSTYSTEQRVRLIERFDPHALQVTPAYAARLEDEVRQAGHDRWPGRLKALLVVGESFTDRWIQALEAFWGVKAFEYYGTSQATMGHATSCHLGVLDEGRRGMMHNLDPLSLCEVIDPETGIPVGDSDAGEVVQTPLFKFGSPVIRFKTDDKVIFRTAASCRCGLPWAGILAGEVSRYDDMIKAKGQNFWPAAVHDVIDRLLPSAEYRGRVFVDGTGRERVALRLEVEDDAVASEVERALRDRINVTFEIEKVRHGTLDRFEFKSRRWEDTRKVDREVIAYREKS